MSDPGEWLLSLAGSEVAGVQTAPGRLRLLLAAAAVRRPAVDAPGRHEDGYLPGTALVFSGARWRGAPGSCFGNLSRGEVVLPGKRTLHLPVRFASSGPLQAEFVFQNGEHLMVEAEGLVIDVPPDARWLPSLAC